MIQISKDIKLFCGDAKDFEFELSDKDQPPYGIKEGWSVVHACKEPYHRSLLGYTGRGAPKEHPEYAMAQRDKRLYLNIVDTPDKRFFSRTTIQAAIDFVREQLKAGQSVLVHCNEGHSRGPSITMLYLAAYTSFFKDRATLVSVEKEFKTHYPPYCPAPGIRGHLEENWSFYVK